MAAFQKFVWISSPAQVMLLTLPSSQECLVSSSLAHPKSICKETTYN
jgi:hypothetical protein